MECRLARFYGWTPSEVANLELEEMAQYQAGMMQIEAQEKLLDISVASFPKSDKVTSQQKKLHKQLHSAGYPKEKKPMTLDELESYMRTYGR